MNTTCQHCRRCKASRPRGLCWTCYYTPGVRELYPSTSKFARRGIGNITGNMPLPTCPTVCLPGSAAKVAILAERARLQQALWHPLDVAAEEVERAPELALLAG